MKNIYLAVPLICLAAAVITGLLGPWIGRRSAHWITILSVGAAFCMSLLVYADVRAGNTFDGALYTWAVSGGVPLEIGFLIDPLSAMMMVVVTFVSLMVHIYTVGYMAKDPGYQRFFCYISLFTFAMLMLVMSDNFLQLFFGWEAVGLVSYLLIGFWYKRERAIVANLKAFLVNRVGDFGFLLGIAAIFYLFGTLDYAAVFAGAEGARDLTFDTPFGKGLWITAICLLLFVGAMGKSAQAPLHVWLPDSMEGPTPISALIHAATMVTAGIFMVARMSPLFELSDTALSVVLVVGATTAILMALVALVQNDIKRVVAYSTLSQLGYMTVALGASAYHVAIFHLGTHAFFKALLFLGAGSVIVALHHEQDMRKMGGLRTIMPITYITSAIGTLALVGIPPFSGFFSKDAIIEAARHSDLWGARYAYSAVLCGVFVTACYAFRMLFMTFHGNNRSAESLRRQLHESPGVITWPLVGLAIPSVFVGMVFFEAVAGGTFFGDSLYFAATHGGAPVTPPPDPPGGLAMKALLHGVLNPPLWLALSGIAVAWYGYCYIPGLPAKIAAAAGPLYTALRKKYGFDELYQAVFARGTVRLGGLLWRRIDAGLVDGWVVNGIARVVGRSAALTRRIQTGLTYHYAFVMIIGLFFFITLFVWW